MMLFKSIQFNPIWLCGKNIAQIPATVFLFENNRLIIHKKLYHNRFIVGSSDKFET